MMVRAILLANLVTMVLGGMIEVRSALPEQTRVAVWSNTDTYGAGTKGKIQSDSALTNTLALGELS
jgi:hypothetical protein